MIQAEALGYEAPVDGAQLLRDITLAVAPGERVGILGPSGAGKSTLAFHLCGLHGLALGGRTCGNLRLAGQDALLGGPKGFGGLVLQNPEAQIFCRTVEEEVRLGLRAGGHLDALLESSGLEPIRRQDTDTLSLGWKQRVAIASMLAMEPQVLFLDEPTNYLDAGAADALFDRLDGLGEMTVLVADHDERRLAGWADRILRLEAGALVWDGPADRFLPAGPLEPRLPTRAPGSLLLAFHEVTFGFRRDHPVVAGFSLDLREGEVVALLGPNGSGKTTLLRLAKGLLRPQKGRIMCGRDEDPMRSVGLVFQNPDDALFAPTVEQECAFLPRNLGLANVRERALEALDRVGLAQVARRTPFSLSYGEKRRLGLAAVAAGEGRILCLDEPTVGLDRANQAILADLLADQAQRGGAVLFSTHDEAFAAAVATRILRLAAAEGRA